MNCEFQAAEPTAADNDKHHLTYEFILFNKIINMSQDKRFFIFHFKNSCRFHNMSVNILCTR